MLRDLGLEIDEVSESGIPSTRTWEQLEQLGNLAETIAALTVLVQQNWKLQSLVAEVAHLESEEPVFDPQSTWSRRVAVKSLVLEGGTSGAFSKRLCVSDDRLLQLAHRTSSPQLRALRRCQGQILKR